jgi:DAK2 domain fusion protein YloV
MADGWQLIQSWAQHAVGGLTRARAEIDALNVFPVPDGDTGTNVLLTMSSARDEVDAHCSDADLTIAGAARALARGALMGARGNSGVILSQILRGASEAIVDEGSTLSSSAIVRMLRQGEALAYAAVAEPVEGTILTVARAAADAAERVSSGTPIETLRAAADAAHDALARTPDLLPVLRDAGVVDAGGRGLTVVLDALLAALTGQEPPQIEAGLDFALSTHVASVDYIGPAFEVMYLLDAEDEAVDGLRRELANLGDCLVVVGGEGLWNIHVHVDDAGAAIEAALAAGRPHRIRVTHLHATGPRHVQERAIIAVSHGPGMGRVLQAAGAHTVPARRKEPPSTAAMVEAITQSGASEIIVLPSDADIRAVADLAADHARGAGLRVSVIPTKSIVQSLAAVAVHDPDARFDDDVVAMTRAAGATRYGAITTASRAALTMAGPCEAGDVLGLVNGDIAVVGTNEFETVMQLLEGLFTLGGELLTIVFGEQAESDMRDRIVTTVETRFPLVELVVYDGGQPLWPVIFGVE